MSNTIDDNRFVLIEKYKQKLIEGTNISDRPEEMAVLDNILFRFWQMGWLDKLEEESHWIPVTERLPKEDGNYLVSGKWESGKESVGDCEFSVEDGYFQTAWNFDVLAWRELPEPYKGVTT